LSLVPLLIWLAPSRNRVSASHSVPVCPLETLSWTPSLVKVNFMSLVTVNPDDVAISDFATSLSHASMPEDVVEIGLLLPAHWAVALVELSKQRHESVGQLLRALIGRELVENDAAL
jgi:hypothetical protein